MALTVRNYIEYADLVGWTDKQLMQAILLLHKQQNPDLHVKLNVKKGDFFVFFKALVPVATAFARSAENRTCGFIPHNLGTDHTLPDRG